MHCSWLMYSMISIFELIDLTVQVSQNCEPAKSRIQAKICELLLTKEEEISNSSKNRALEIFDHLPTFCS